MQATTALHRAATRMRSIANPWPALGVLFLGLVVLYAVGFSTIPQAHNAAHDTGHASGFLATEVAVSQFQKLMLVVLLSGALAGLALFVIQHYTVIPLYLPPPS